MDYKKIEQDVFKILSSGLNSNLHYHGLHHTRDVLKNTLLISEKENINEENKLLLKLAALLHDIGFIEKYDGHEEAGCKLSKEILPSYDIGDEDIEKICGMIMATKIPQNPKTQLEKIIADADLMYLGTNSFNAIGNTLFRELMENNKLKNEMDWNKIQASFLSNHHFHTDFCINSFTQKKVENLESVLLWLEENN
jgi:uncharacterized protein